MDALSQLPSAVNLRFCNDARGRSATCLTASHSDPPEMASIVQLHLLRCVMHPPSPTARQRTPGIQILSFRVAPVLCLQMPPPPTSIQRLATSEGLVRRARRGHQLLPTIHTSVATEVRPDSQKPNDNHYAHCHKLQM